MLQHFVMRAVNSLLASEESAGGFKLGLEGGKGHSR